MTNRRASRRKASNRANENGPGSPSGPGRDRMWIGDQPVGFDELMAEADRISTTVDDEGRTLFVDDPAIGLGAMMGLSPSGEPITDDTAGQVPVALFEPRKAMMVRQQDGRVREAQAEAAVTLGPRSFLAGVTTLQRAEGGWLLRRLTGNTGLELVDSTGSVFSRIQHPIPPEWVSAAVSHGDVLVIYGTSIGVRVPEGVTEAGYGPAKRAAELKQSRALGTVAAGYVPWAG